MRVVYLPVWEMLTKLINYMVHHAIFAFQRNGCFLINTCMRKPANKKSSPKWDLLQGNLAEGGEKEVQHK